MCYNINNVFMVTPLCKKSTQAINYFARKKDGKINKMKAVKLIYFADRYHLRKYGRPIVGDDYWAMKLGPVGSNLLNTANLSKEKLESDCFKYAKGFLRHNAKDTKKQTIVSKREVDLGVFSQTDIEALEVVFKEFGDQDQFELADISHNYPEWKKHEKEILIEKKLRTKMNYLDFFLNPRSRGLSIFEASDVDINSSKNIYQESEEVKAILC